MRAWLLFLCCVCAAGGAAAQGRSAGCGVAATGTGNFVAADIAVHGRERTYHLRVPGDYDPKRAYSLVFRWHGRGGDGLSGGLEIERSAGNDAIVVGADGRDKTWGADDLDFFDGMLEAIEKRYCIDRGRIFSYGFSAGGYFTNLLACRRGYILRASAVVAGGVAGEECRGGRVAGWFLHDTDDEAVPIAQGRAALQGALAANGCANYAVDEGEGCLRYQGCAAAPVVWCQSSGIGHDIRGEFAPARVWKFFQSLP